MSTICHAFLALALSMNVIWSATFPKRGLGFYCLVADDGEAGYTSSDNWQPQLYDYQIQGANIIWLTFINPQNMTVPPAMANLAKCRDQAGCPNSSTPVIFSVGGQGYSEKLWPWLQTAAKAEAMAQTVSTWASMYGADGIDLDIEGVAGNDNTSANNLLLFAQKLRALAPQFIITQPVYGYPQITAENTMVNNGWTVNGQSTGLLQSVGIMVYKSDQSLEWVTNYANATSKNGDFPITVNVASDQILCGIDGTASSNSISTMAKDVVSQDLGGMMVWYASVYDKTRNKKAFNYGHGDATAETATYSAWVDALETMNGISKYTKH